MKAQDFQFLTGQQRHALVIAMVVRNALEDFHVAHLSDGQMKELNQLVRFGIYDAISLMETMKGDRTKEFVFGWLVSSIPDYWEIPDRDPDPIGVTRLDA